MAKPTFEQWKANVGREVAKICSLGCDDIPDYDYRMAYDNDFTPAQTAHKALEAADFPFDPDWMEE